MTIMGRNLNLTYTVLNDENYSIGNAYKNWTNLDLSDYGADFINNLSALGNFTKLNCDDWLEAQHVLFQLANLCFCISFLTPNSFRFHLIFIRGILTIGSMSMVVYGGTVICMIDILAWNLVFFVINLAHFCFLVFKLCPVRLEKCLEDLYMRSFKPLKVSRHQFRDLTRMARIKSLPAGANYARERETKAGKSVSILISGRLKVTYGELFLHHIEPAQFVDSPEFESVPVNEDEIITFQVSISALEDSRLLTWPVDKLRLFLLNTRFTEAIFTTLVGKDITHKLYQVQELLLSRSEKMKSHLLHHRHQLGSNLSSHSLHLALKPVTATLLSPASSTASDGAPSPRITTPVRPYSPSQVSFETCV